jgi:hypothetical protein
MCSQIENYHKLLTPKFKKKAQADTPGWLKGTIYFENNMHQKKWKAVYFPISPTNVFQHVCVGIEGEDKHKKT